MTSSAPGGTLTLADGLTISRMGYGAMQPQQVALAWLLQRSATIALIPGTSSLAHLYENVAAADLVLPADAVAELDTIGR